MSVLASDVMDRTAALLNDVAKNLYTYTVQLPYLKIANDDLSDELVDHGATPQKEVAADIDYTADTTDTTSLALPNDFILPIELYEKNTDEDDSQFRLMEKKEFEPNTEAGDELKFYAYREQQIIVPKCTQDKVLRLRYFRLLTTISAQNSPVEIALSLNYLAHHTAAFCARYIGRNTILADNLEGQAILRLNKLLKREVKNNQASPVRRKAFRINTTSNRRLV